MSVIKGKQVLQAEEKRPISECGRLYEVVNENSGQSFLINLAEVTDLVWKFHRDKVAKVDEMLLSLTLSS